MKKLFDTRFSLVYIVLVRRGQPHRIGDADMTNSARFIEAHKTAKQIRDCFDSYRGAFAFALTEIYAMERQEKKENRWETAFKAAFEAAEKDADALKIDGEARATYVCSNVRSRLSITACFDLATVKDRMGWDPSMTRDAAIYSAMMMAKRLESLLEGKSRENASPRVTARFKALDEMRAFLSEMCA
jgi:hypothetical protein